MCYHGYCSDCTILFPFANLNDTSLTKMLENRIIKNQTLSNCPAHLKNLFKDLNNHISHSIIDCKYNDINDYNSLKIKTVQSSDFLHLNISSLPFHIDELKLMINSMDTSPEVIGITESRLKQSKQSITDIALDNYQIEQCPTEASNGGALLYISSETTYKTRHDLQIYKSRELESVFIEIVHPLDKNIIVGAIYRHPSMSVKEFNSTFLNIPAGEGSKRKRKHYSYGGLQYGFIKVRQFS